MDCRIKSGNDGEGPSPFDATNAIFSLRFAAIMRCAGSSRRDPSRNEQWPNRAKRRAMTRMRRRCRSRAGSPRGRARRRSRPISKISIRSRGRRLLAAPIDSGRTGGLTPAQVPAGEAASFAGGRGKKLYTAFQERLKVLNAADFGDLLLECIRLFRDQSEVLRQYQARFRYILVDEYQDTNVAQYLWLRLLGQSIPTASLPGLTPEVGVTQLPAHNAAQR